MLGKVKPKFTQKIFHSCQDIVFKFGRDVADEPPLLAHGNLLSFHSHVFASLIAENKLNRDSEHRSVLNVDSDKETFKAFIEGIYNGSDKSLLLTLHGSKKLLALAQTYQLEEDLVSGLFSDITLWPCLRYALESLPKKSKLLRKCEEVAKFD